MPELGIKKRILVIGGYRVFGGRLSKRLAKHSDLEIIVAGRTILSAQSHIDQHRGVPMVIKAGHDLNAIVADIRPTVVIDAAGPFQNSRDAPYRVAEATIANGAHYLDLADDSAFVIRISALAAIAKKRSVTVLSGCSSVPAISAAAVRVLSEELKSIDSISSVILPGNRAPRGRSVIAAILDQVGKPIKTWRSGTWQTVRGWCDVGSCRPVVMGRAIIGRRFASTIDAPDLQLFPEHFSARTVRFRAGLELSAMPLGLAAIAWIVRLGLLGSAIKLIRPLHWIANRLEPFGSDRGAMTVDVVGRDSQGEARCNRWTLIAEAGDGPEIPPTAAYLLALKLCRQTHAIAPGARPCLDELTLVDIEAGLAPYQMSTEQPSQPFPTVVERALRDQYANLPPAIQHLHGLLDTNVFVGNARIERGRGLLSRMIGWCAGFSPAGENVPVRVDMLRTQRGEAWQRRVGNARFHSHLSHQPGARRGEIWERFGHLSFRIQLRISDAIASHQLHYPVDAMRAFGWCPLPQVLLPISDTREYVDHDGNACFDVKISHPLAGFIVRYQGWLQPIEALPPESVSTV